MAKTQTISFLTQPLGLNTVSLPTYLSPNELTKALNVKLNDFNQLVTREGISKISSTATVSGSAIISLACIPIKEENYIFLQDANFNLYVSSGTEPNLHINKLATLDGKAQILSFNDYAVICDGSYIKQTQGETVDLCYDDGEGLDGYNYSNLCNMCNTFTRLHTLSGSRCGCKFETQDWGSFGTIPLTSLDIWLSKEGTISGSITASLYDSTGNTLLNTSTTSLYDSDLTSNAMLLRFAFDDSYGMASETEYIAAVEFLEGNETNYLKVHGKTCSSGTTGDEYIYQSGWTPNTEVLSGLGIKPGKPHKASFGAINNLRAFLAGDPDNPGRLWFSNINTVLDFSTTGSFLSTNTWAPDGGGWIGAVDDSAHQFAIGGVTPLFNDLFIFGTKVQPFLSKLTGKTPNEFKLPSTFQHISTQPYTVISLINDIWFGSDVSVHSISGVDSYGDVRTFSPGDPIKNIIQEYFNDNAFCGFNPKEAQFMLKMEGYDNILVVHTAQPVTGETGQVRYVWTEYNFKDLDVTSFATINNNLYFGCSNGYIYKLDENTIKDDNKAFDVELKSGILDYEFGSKHARKLAFSVLSSTTASGICSFYKNKSITPFWDKDLIIENTSLEDNICFVCNSLQLYLHNFNFDSSLAFGSLHISAYDMRSR